jgi:uncharacterized protein with FMN-binding domain
MVLMIGAVGCKSSEEIIKQITIEDVNLKEVKDGRYRGEHTANDLVKAVVEVEVKEHQIKEIKLIEHDNWRGEKAEVMPNKVIKAQSLAVDTVSGATVSSKVILKAIEIALSKGIAN